MTIKDNFPNARPSLELDFTKGSALDSRVTFSRATTATYYDGKTTAVAEQNLMLYSQQLDQTGFWVKYNSSVTANSNTAPDGTSTACTFIEDNTTNTHKFVVGAIGSTLTVSTPYTFSIYAKANTRNFLWVDLVYSGVSSYRTWFNLSTGSVGTSAGGNAASMVSMGNGWYRCIVTRSTAVAQTGMTLEMGLSNADNVVSYLGDGTSSIYLWGSQFEQRSSVTAYNPTGLTVVTNYIPVLQTALSNTPRFDYNPNTGIPNGLLIEEQRTNLLSYSDDLNSWGKGGNGATYSNTVIAPDGSLTGDTLYAATSGNDASIYKFITFSASPYTISIYAKSAGKSILLVQSIDTGAGYPAGYFNVSSGTITFLGSGVTGTINSVGNGWYRCSITYTATASTSPVKFFICDASGSSTATANTYAGLYLWGAQLESLVQQSSFLTSYIPTGASTATRAPEYTSMVGTNFSSWYNSQQSTIYAKFYSVAQLNKHYVTFSDGSFSNEIDVSSNQLNTSAEFVIRCGGSLTLDLYNYTFNTNLNTQQVAASFSSNTQYNAFNGGIATSSTSLQIPTVNKLTIGVRGDSVEWINGYIQKIIYYPQILTSTQLQNLTTN